MDKDRERIDRFVRKLASDTEAGLCLWTNRSSIKRADATGLVYHALISTDKEMIAYRYVYQYWLDEEHSEPSEDIAIEFVGSHGEKLWQLPQVDGRFQLMDAIERQYSGADDVIRSYLGE